MVDEPRRRSTRVAWFTCVTGVAVLFGVLVGWAAWPRDEDVRTTEDVPTVVGTSPELSVVTTRPPPTTRPPTTSSEPTSSSTTSSSTTSSTTTSTKAPKPTEDDDEDERGNRDRSGRGPGRGADDDG